MIHPEAAVDHKTSIDASTTGAVHYDLTQHTGHIADHPNIEALWVIDPKITVDHIHDRPTNFKE